jgi:hypothetical protein
MTIKLNYLMVKNQHTNNNLKDYKTVNSSYYPFVGNWSKYLEKKPNMAVYNSILFSS